MWLHGKSNIWESSLHVPTFFVRFFGSSILHPYYVVRLIMYSFQIASNLLPKNACEVSLMISIVLLTFFLTIFFLTEDCGVHRHMKQVVLNILIKLVSL